MSYNIGPKIGIDGETEFRNSINRINSSYKTMSAEIATVTAALGKQATTEEKLQATKKVLQRQIEEQKEKVALLTDAIGKATEKFGANSLEATRLRSALYDTKATIIQLETELDDTDTSLKHLRNGMSDVEEATENAGAAAIDFGDVLKANLVSDLIMDGLREMAELVKEFASGSIEAAADVQAATAQFEQTFKGIETAASDALDSISDDTNIASTRMRGSFTTLYAFAKNAGAGTSEALNLSSRAMVAAADNAAYYDKSIEEATEQLQSFLKGNYENDAALGISATETTRNTKANELYAKSFNKLSESQKVDVLLAMVEAGNEASGAIGQAARESESWENVTGELAEVMRLLQAEAGKPALKKLVPIIKDITAAGYELIDDIDWEKFGETVENIADSVIEYGPGVVKAIAAVAAGIAAFKATQRIKEFASLAQSFIGIGTAAKTAGTAVAASGAMAAATPWGLVATVIGGVVSAISLVALNSEKVQTDLEKATAELAETIEEANATCESSKGEIEGAAYAAEYYVARLRELEEAGLDTAVAHREYEQVVEQLNELIPDLNLEIDEQTGLINTDTDALKANIQAWKNNAVAKALQDKYTDVLEAQGEATAELLDAEARLNTLLAQRADLEQAVKTKAAERERVSKRLTDVQEKLASAENLTAEESERLYKEWADLEEQYSSMSYDLALLSHDLQDTADKQSVLTEDIEKAEAAVDSYEGAIAQLEAATELYAEKTAAATRETEILSDTELQLQKNLESLEQEYAEAEASARESIDSQIGLFEEITMESDWSAEKILKNWETQRAAFDKYSENLQKAVDLGLDETLVQQLSDGSVESMQILNALVNDIDADIDKINASFARTSESRDHAAETMAGVQTEYETRFDAIVAAAEEAGKDISGGLARGVSQNSSTFVNAMGSVGKKGLNEFRYTYDSHSPSRVMIAEGKNIDTGAALGVDKNVELFERSMISLADLGYDAFLEKRIDRATSYPEMVSEYSTVNSRSVAHNYGGMSFVINQQPGESAEDLAYRIMDIIHTEVESKEASIYG